MGLDSPEHNADDSIVLWEYFGVIRSENLRED